ncbi:MAG: sugar phosphate isomerase/epimerase [Anaerolineae bacterium]|nr:sugar phosphate isomerase/epimerase [Anaerolineae bacterium]
MMKLAFTTLACPNWSLQQVIDAAQHNGYAGLEFRLYNGEVITPTTLDPSARALIKSSCRAAGLQIPCLDTSVRVATPDAEQRAAHLRDGLAMLEIAADWESPFIRVFGSPPADTPVEVAKAAAIDCLTPLAKRGQELGVTVLLETHDAFSSTVTVMDVLNQVPAAGALWDTLHPCRVGELPTESAGRLGNRTLHVHVKDGRPANGENWDLTLLGEGDVPIPTILAVLHGRGYDGWLSVEWEKKWHPDIAEPEIAIPQHADLLRQYLREISD